MTQPQDLNPYAAPTTFAPSESTEAAEFPGVDPGATVTFGTRAGARIIDIVASYIASFAGGLLFAGIAAALAASGKIDGDWAHKIGKNNFLINWGGGLIASLACHTVAEGVGGASIGKLILGLRVVLVNGRPPDVLATFQRSLAYIVDSFFFALPAYNSMKQSPLNQRIGDKWADTTVVRAAEVPDASKRSTGVAVVGAFAGLMVEGLVLMGMLFLAL